MANPPPNNPLLPVITTGAIVPTYVIDRIEVFQTPTEDNNEAQTSLTLTSHFVESIKQNNTNEALKWYDLEQYTSQVRLRVVICNDRQVCQRLDYLQQRFNEYVSGQMGPVNSVSADMLSELLQRSTNNDEIIGHLLRDFGPFDAGDLTQHFLETRDRTYNYEHFEMDPVLGKTLVYDIPAVNLLQSDNNGNVLRRKTHRTVSMDDGNGNISRHIIEEIPAQPISINLDVGEEDMAQFSIYSFAYFDVFSYTDGEVQSIGREVFTVAESGLGYISAANFSGEYSVYSPQDQAVFEENDGETRLVPRVNTPTRIVGMVTPRLYHAPNGDQMHDFRSYTNIAIENLSNRIFENLPRKVGVSHVGNKRNVIIGDKNYFSHLWLSKDVAEGCRYSFSFALRGFMINNSRFPWLYQNQSSAQELLDGGSIILRRNESGVDERTQILNINMTKRLIDFEEFAVINELGTSVRQHEQELGPYNEETVISPPRRLDFIHVENDPNEKIIFYEGRDDLADEKLTQQLSRIQYGARFLIKDSAETYIIRHIEILEKAAKNTRNVFEFIVHSPPPVDIEANPPGGMIENGIGLFDYQTMTTRFPLSRISLGRDRMLSAEEEVTSDIEKYIASLLSFGVIGQEESNSLLEKLKSLMNSSNPQGLQIIANSMDTFAGVLRETVGDESRRFLGDFRENQQNKITGRGTYEQKVPLFECEHYFDSFATSGLTFGTGYEYLRQTENNSQAHGLIRISLQNYIDRTVEEFRKYFYFSKDMGVSDQAAAYSPSYANSSATFLTPSIVRTYGKDFINQPLYRNLNGPNTAYDLDRYAELFGDLVKIADKSAYLKGSYYMLENETENDPENNQLYNSIITSLVERHMFNIKFDDLIETPSIEPVDSTPLVPLDRSQLDGLNLFNVVAGGSSDLSFDAVTWRSNQANAQEEAFSTTSPKGAGPIKGIPKPSPPNPRIDLPIKLVFSILGELELDPAYYTTPNYMSQEFNSIKNQAMSLGLTADNIKDVLEGDFSSLPNQTKSMFVVAMSNQNLFLGPGFEATRNLLEEAAGPLNPLSKTTAFIEDANLPYKETLDTMKIYSKMLAYWLNYKEICVIEYLRGFEKTSDDLMQTQSSVVIGGEKVDMSMQGQTVIATNPYTSKPKLPVWEKLTPEKLRVTNARNLLCRIRRIIPSDSESRVVKEEMSNASSGLYGLVGGDVYDKNSSDKGQPKIVTQQVDFHRRELFNLPIYNQYFILGTTGYKGED